MKPFAGITPHLIFFKEEYLALLKYHYTERLHITVLRLVWASLGCSERS